MIYLSQLLIKMSLISNIALIKPVLNDNVKRLIFKHITSMAKNIGYN